MYVVSIAGHVLPCVHEMALLSRRVLCVWSGAGHEMCLSCFASKHGHPCLEYLSKIYNEITMEGVLPEI
jgi:hypothetical protein